MIIKKKSIEEIADFLMDKLKKRIHSTEGEFHLALSGGNTPIALFNHFKKHYSDFPYWNKIHFWWGDERLVPFESKDSNAGTACRTLLNLLPIPKEHIHLVNGQSPPEKALEEYNLELEKLPKNKEGKSYVHWQWLGLGDDGHTASLFPDFNDWDFQGDLLIRKNPYNGQERITFAPALLNRSTWLSFIVTGESKAKVFSEIQKESHQAENYPAFKISKKYKKLEWICDEDVLSLM
ncbi:MAG: 6-phosphogluconolactonase [Spirochaetaceae bacterium]|jgi:6-phosphogluconolactonase|nr:6-phosphogluconolactonase [Spirochaetaceae bacterium]